MAPAPWLDPETIRLLLDDTHTWAVVGLSGRKFRPSYGVSEYMQRVGYRIIPVNPGESEILGEKCYPTILAAPGPLDTVTIYLNPSRSTPLIDQIISANPKRIILNPGAENPALASHAIQSNIEVLEACTLVLLRTGQF